MFSFGVNNDLNRPACSVGNGSFPEPLEKIMQFVMVSSSEANVSRPQVPCAASQ